jgi:hypothetical protein
VDFSKEDVEKNHFLLTKSIQQLISKNTKIKVNDYEIELESKIKQKYLSASNLLLIEEGKENKTEE